MSQFRPKKLEIGGFTNTWILRDYTKRKTYAKYEVERYVNNDLGTMLLHLKQPSPTTTAHQCSRLLIRAHDH